MQGETGSLRDLKRYHLEHHGMPRTILEEPSGTVSDGKVSKDVEIEDDCDIGGSGFDSSANSLSDDGSESEHMLRLREFQVKLLASSNNAYNSRSKSGRRHTLCLTR